MGDCELSKISFLYGCPPYPKTIAPPNFCKYFIYKPAAEKEYPSVNTIISVGFLLLVIFNLIFSIFWYKEALLT